MENINKDAIKNPSDMTDKLVYLFTPEIIERETIILKSKIIEGLKKFRINTDEKGLHKYIKERISLVKNIPDTDYMEFCLDFKGKLKGRKTLVKLKTNWSYE